MTLLLDADVILEALLGQQQADSVQRLLDHGDGAVLYLTDFSLHSIGVVLLRNERVDAFRWFLDDMVVTGILKILSVPPHELAAVLDASTDFRLDFDDAYQYVASGQLGAQLVSFDTDFDRTDRKRKTPAEVLVELAGGDA